MQLIEPSFEIIEQEDLYKHIELCGRTCYKSTDKITDESAKPFVDRMINSKHYAMLEHGTIYLTIPENDLITVKKYEKNRFSKWRGVYYPKEDISRNYITTNLRVIAENNWWDDLQYMCKPTEHHAKRYTVKFICNRQVSHEFVRHRVFSFAQESTRYCNYSKDKFGNELTFIKPCWTEGEEFNVYKDGTEALSSCLRASILSYPTFVSVLKCIESAYNSLIGAGWQAQQAATILPNAIKTELIMTGFAEDWEHFFDLRALGTTGAPHPQAKQLAMPLYEEFINRGYINAR